MNNYNARIQDLILEINDTLAPKHFSEGHPEPTVFHRYRREVIDCPKRPMGSIMVEVSTHTLLVADQHRVDIIITMDSNAARTCNDGWMNFHAHIVNFEFKSRGQIYSPLTLRITDDEAGDAKRMVGFLADLLSKFKE